MTTHAGSDAGRPFPALVVMAPTTALLAAWVLVEDASPTVRAAIVVLVIGAAAFVALNLDVHRPWVGYAAGGTAVLLPLLVTSTGTVPRESLLLILTSGFLTASVIISLTATLRRQSRQVRQLGVLKSNFVALANHELRTPITILHGTLDVLKHDLQGDLTPQQAQFLSAAWSSSSALAYLVEMMTQFEALESDAAPGAVAPVALGHIVSTVAADLKDVFHQHHVELRLAMDGAAARITVPQTYTRIILVQLLRNAAKFNRPGGSALVRSRLKEGQLTIDVVDDGDGIPAESYATIFESFYQQGDLLSRTNGGIGLGLALVKLAAAKMSGTVTVTSEVGRGSTFTVSLPARVVAGDGG